MKKNKISFFTVSMDRLHHLKQTYLKNIEDNLPYGSIEFILLDYNSKDDLEAWAEVELGSLIDLGVVKFFRTNEPSTYHPAHSRNIALKMTTGDIVCNLDADNFLGKEFADYINYQFSFYDDIFMTSAFLDGSFGRVCARRKDIVKISGYDEELSGWGHEDEDICNRLMQMGVRKKLFGHRRFTNFIQHENLARVINGRNVSRIKSIYVRHIESRKSELLYFLDGDEFIYGIISIEKQFRSIDLETKWRNGSYHYRNRDLILEFENKTNQVLKVFPTSLETRAFSYFLITNQELHNRAIIIYSALINKQHLLNSQNKTRKVNSQSWGKASLVMNFSKDLSS